VPGQLLLQLGAVAQGQRRGLDIAPSFMRRLSREVRLTVVLSQLGTSGPVVSLVTKTGTFPILVTVRVGTILDMDSAQGHLFLRFSKDEETVTRYWRSLEPETRVRGETSLDNVLPDGLAGAGTPSMNLSVLAAPSSTSTRSPRRSPWSQHITAAGPGPRKACRPAYGGPGHHPRTGWHRTLEVRHSARTWDARPESRHFRVPVTRSLRLLLTACDKARL
jgi:hypothetical protein